MTDFQWWAAIILAAGFMVFLFWIAYTIIEARELAREEEPKVYEEYACAQCGNYTVWRSPGWSVCDCCGMKTEL